MQLFVNIDVDDLERAIEFYQTGLGLRLQRRLFAGLIAEMVGTSATIHLLTKPSGSGAFRGAAAARDYRRHWTPVHLDFVVEDIAAAVERATTAGATLEGEIRSSHWGAVATLSDPFGHGFCLIQLSRQGYDAVAG